MLKRSGAIDGQRGVWYEIQISCLARHSTGNVFFNADRLYVHTSAQTSNPPDPDGLLDDLYWAMTGGVGAPPAPNWEARLDPGFSRWRTGSSENWGPIAHAIALWRYDVNSPDTVTWWNTFFDCQNGGACSVPGVTD